MDTPETPTPKRFDEIPDAAHFIIEPGGEVVFMKHGQTGRPMDLSHPRFFHDDTHVFPVDENTLANDWDIVNAIKTFRHHFGDSIRHGAQIESRLIQHQPLPARFKHSIATLTHALTNVRDYADLLIKALNPPDKEKTP